MITVLIATHGRIPITTYNIVSLLDQSLKPQIILIVSDPEEEIFYSMTFPEIKVFRTANSPLGGKWQYGVSVARNLGANPLIILGSDDLLGSGFIADSFALIESGVDFVGLKRWYIHHKGTAYYMQYLSNLPLGGGRVYSRRLLERINWELFHPRLVKHLDDYAIKRMRLYAEPYIADLDIHAIKGNWECINPFTLRHKNIQLISKHKSEDFFKDLPCV